MILFLLGILLITILLLSAAIGVSIWLRNKNEKIKDHTHRLEEHIEEIESNVADHNDRFRGIIDLDKEAEEISNNIANKKTRLDELDAKCSLRESMIDKLKEEMAIYKDMADSIEFGIYEPIFDFDAPEDFKVAIKECKETQRGMIKLRTAFEYNNNWTVGGSKTEGKKMTDRLIKLTARAFNGDCDTIITGAKYNNMDNMATRIEKSFDAINKLNEVNEIKIAYDYLKIKLMELRLTHEYKVKRQEWKEEQAEFKRQLKEDAKAEAELKKAIESAEKEEEKYATLLERARKEAAEATGAQLEKLNAQVSAFAEQLEAAQSKKREKSLAQMTKRGYVYVLSNIGSFGEGVYKIGMTRREDPSLRVKELGDASVPFLFDVHAMILVNNAPSFEKAMHREFNDKRVNKINNRKEFFRVDLLDIQKAVGTVSNQGEYNLSNPEFTMSAQAKEYYETRAMENNK